MSETRELQVILSSGEVTSTYQGGTTAGFKYLMSSEIDTKIALAETTLDVTDVDAATYDLLVADKILSVSYTATGSVAITLPTAQVASGRKITVKDAGGSAGANNITVDTEGAETIDGAATAVISGNYNFISIYCDGTNWFLY